MPRCEDYPCCGHGPEPYGDGGGCPDEEGRFNCVLCGKKLDASATSSICGTKECNRAERRRAALEDGEYYEEDDDPREYEVETEMERDEERYMVDDTFDPEDR